MLECRGELAATGRPQWHPWAQTKPLFAAVPTVPAPPGPPSMVWAVKSPLGRAHEIRWTSFDVRQQQLQAELRFPLGFLYLSL